jgi:hypothetical protein
MLSQDIVQCLPFVVSMMNFLLHTIEDDKREKKKDKTDG